MARKHKCKKGSTEWDTVTMSSNVLVCDDTTNILETKNIKQQQQKRVGKILHIFITLEMHMCNFGAFSWISQERKKLKVLKLHTVI